MGKKPLNQNQVKSLRKLVKDKPLHDLLLNLSVDLMLRSSDLLSEVDPKSRTVFLMS